MSGNASSDTEHCPDCKAPWTEHEQGFCPHEIETGEEIMHSELSGYTYRVTKWVPQGEGQFIALQKERIDRSEDTETERGVSNE